MSANYPYSSSLYYHLAAYQASPTKQQPPKELPKEIVAAPVEGWRIWHVRRPETVTLTAALVENLADQWDLGNNPFRTLIQPELHPVGSNSGPWKPGAQEATCHAGPQMYAAERHQSPGPRCHCGFWALKEEADLWTTLGEYNANVYGRVQMWGRLIEHEKGWRAQFAKPTHLYLISDDDRLALDLAAAYGCPVERVERPEASVPQPGTTAAAALMQQGLQQTSLAVQQAYYNQLASQMRYVGSPPQWSFSSSASPRWYVQELQEESVSLWPFVGLVCALALVVIGSLGMAGVL